MNNLFFWAIQNSDPDKLKEHAANADPEKTRRDAEVFFTATQSTSKPVDPSKLLKEKVQILSKSKEEVSNEERYYSLRVIGDLIDKIDFANDFHKLNGTTLMMNMLKDYLNCEQFDEELYVLALEAAESMAVCFHNNQWMQLQDQVQNEVFPFVIDTLRSGKLTDRSRLLEKFVSILSAICSNQPYSLVRFLVLDGVNSLIVPLVTELNEVDTDDSNKLISKLMFLLFNLSVAEESLPEKTALAPLLLDNHDLLIEKVLEKHLHMKSESEIDLIEKTLLVLRDLSGAEHVKDQYQKIKANSNIPQLLTDIEKEVNKQEDQDRFYDIKSYIEEINFN